ncbi:MAG TPA: amylo-alpha-1,6-glucosidase [Candidatus Paceibacterota bacterium]|nr:amylo-alpha-1,6-glucosidase [Candidatus Paceibacterota bacterium]
MPKMNAGERRAALWELGYSTIKELETDQGILASGRSEIFGCVFGRDSLITSLELLKAYQKTGDLYFLTLVKKILRNLLPLQGEKVNIESGEEPGKCIHEFRPTDHERLTKAGIPPWYVYPDNIMRNYDSVDATPLLLIAIYRYYETSQDAEFLKEALPNVLAALEWIFIYGDSNGDGLIDYRFHPDRTFGGLRTQSWMDSVESVFRNDDDEPAIYPVAPVEVQAYVYLALRLWREFFLAADPKFAAKLARRAKELRILFNQKFVMKNFLGHDISLAFAIDGSGQALTDARSSMGHVLWAVRKNKNGVRDGILDHAYVRGLVERLMKPDLLRPTAGIRTLTSTSPQFDPKSYHNGSIWPHDTALLIEGLLNFGYRREARRVRRALMSAYEHFKTPIELFVFANGQYAEYAGSDGQGACRKQAWSAGALLAEVDFLRK